MSATVAKSFPAEFRSSTINPWLRLCLSCEFKGSYAMLSRHCTDTQKFSSCLDPASEFGGGDVRFAPAAATSSFYHFTILHPSRNFTPFLKKTKYNQVLLDNQQYLITKTLDNLGSYLGLFVLPQFQELCKNGWYFLCVPCQPAADCFGHLIGRRSHRGAR